MNPSGLFSGIPPEIYRHPVDLLLSLFFWIVGTGVLASGVRDFVARIRVYISLSADSKPLSVTELAAQPGESFVRFDFVSPDGPIMPAPLSGKSSVWWEVSVKNYQPQVRHSRGWLAYGSSNPTLLIKEPLSLAIARMDIALEPSYTTFVPASGERTPAVEAFCLKHLSDQELFRGIKTKEDLHLKNIYFVEKIIEPSTDLIVAGNMKKIEGRIEVYDGALLTKATLQKLRSRKLCSAVMSAAGVLLVAAGLLLAALHFTAGSGNFR